jgi:hypothetical protein
MKKLISFRRASRICIILLGLLLLYHLLIIVGIAFFNFVPIDYLWGGRLESREQLMGNEIMSLTVMALCLFIVTIHSGWVRIPWMRGIARIALWLICVLFILSTIGNVFAETAFEKSFAILSLCLAFLCFRLALEKTGRDQ